ncbi:MAG: aminopeptidase P family protein [Clostridia bacterium]|nr:aminopeptidase P family protein [Clostridia bacterium]
MREYFTSNRERLFEKMEEDSFIIMYSGNEKHKSGDENFPFCVNKNFYYLTGLDKPEIYLVMTKTQSERKAKIFTPRFEKSAWVTPTYTIKQAQTISGVQDVEYIDKFEDVIIPDGLEKYTDFKHIELYEKLNNKEAYKDCYLMVAKLRAVKSDYEIRQIEKAISITRKGLIKLFENFSKCEYEYQAQALFEGEIKYNNSQDLAFSTICASGKNACTLHYSKNTDKLKKGDLLLLDLGAKYNHFSADISRTIPYRAKFNQTQKMFYNIVLNGQKLGLKLAKPGITIRDINQALVEYYFVELKKLKMVKTIDDVKKYYMHSIGHSLGLDTHDEGLFRDEPLVAGNVITMEPGLYIPEYNLGIRIEDDVLITETGNRVLSAKIPKLSYHIETIVK